MRTIELATSWVTYNLSCNELTVCYTINLSECGCMQCISFPNENECVIQSEGLCACYGKERLARAIAMPCMIIGSNKHEAGGNDKSFDDARAIHGNVDFGFSIAVCRVWG